MTPNSHVMGPSTTTLYIYIYIVLLGLSPLVRMWWLTSKYIIHYRYRYTDDMDVPKCHAWRCGDTGRFCPFGWCNHSSQRLRVVFLFCKYPFSFVLKFYDTLSSWAWLNGPILSCELQAIYTHIYAQWQLYIYIYMYMWNYLFSVDSSSIWLTCLLLNL